MGRTSTQSKQLWNSCNYTQIKVSVKPETASAFKNACKISNVSMASVLSEFMDKYSNASRVKGGYAPDLSEKKKRRAVVQTIIQQLERIIENEERYCENIPGNLRESVAFDRAEHTVSSLSEALELLTEAY